MARYTFNELNIDIFEINMKLSRVYRQAPDLYPDPTKWLYLTVQQRNGYTGLDTMRAGDESGSRWSTVGTGTPRECYTFALEFLKNQL